MRISIPENLKYALEAYIITFALLNIAGLTPFHILSIVLFCILFPAVSRMDREIPADRRRTAVSALLSGIYTLFYLAAEHKNLTGGFDNRLFRLFFVLMSAAGLLVLFFHCCKMLLFFLTKPPFFQAAKPLSRRAKWLLFLGLLLCWMPWFLYDFPGVMTPDSLSQFAQATGQRAYSNHHPLVHTLLIQAVYSLGFALTGNTYLSIALYTLVQMILMALIETAVLSLMADMGLKKIYRILTFLLWALLPVHGIYSVTMWKDVLFAGFLMLYALCLYRLLQLKKERGGSQIPGLSFSRDYRLLLLLAASGLLVCLFRSNGLYVFVFTLPFLLYAFRRSLLPMAAVQILVLCAALLIKGPVFDAWQVEKPAFTESLSIPLQQTARVISEGRELTGEQKELLNRVADISYVPEYYNPTLSDPIKALVLYNHADYLEEHKGEYFRLWLEIGLAYPRDYIEAFIDQTKGYWFPGEPDMLVNEGISPNELGLEWKPIVHGLKVTKAVEILLKLPTIFPVYGILFSIGAYTWGALFLAGFCFLHGKRRNLILFLPFAGLIGTLLIATPVASDFRYAYPLILAMPLLIAAALEPKDAA